jgi:hypothetical protein
MGEAGGGVYGVAAGEVKSVWWLLYTVGRPTGRSRALSDELQHLLQSPLVGGYYGGLLRNVPVMRECLDIPIRRIVPMHQQTVIGRLPMVSVLALFPTDQSFAHIQLRAIWGSSLRGWFGTGNAW